MGVVIHWDKVEGILPCLNGSRDQILFHYIIENIYNIQYIDDVINTGFIWTNQKVGILTNLNQSEASIL